MNKPACIECGSAPVNHTLEKISNALDYSTQLVFGPIDRKIRKYWPFKGWFRIDLFFYYFFILTFYLKITGRIYQPAISDSSRTRYLWKSAHEHGVFMYKITVFGRVTEISIAKKNKFKMVFMSLPRPIGPVSESFSWMDNKEIMKQQFRTQNIPVPKGGAYFRLDSALKVFRLLRQNNSPVVVKPVIGSRSRHTHTHILDEQDFIKAFNSVKQISPWVVVEQELEGLGYRITIIGKKIVGILRREPPHILGDGVSTIMEIVEQENKRTERQGPVFHSLPTNDMATRILAEQGYNWSSVPQKNQFVLLSPRHIMNRTPGGSTTDFTDLAHPDNVLLFEKIANFLNDPLVGIDFIIEDMSQSWKNQPNCGVNECNAVPFLDLHQVPLVGKPRDPAGALWKLVLSD